MLEPETSNETFIDVLKNHDINLPRILIQGKKTLELRSESTTGDIENFWEKLFVFVNRTMKINEVNFETTLSPWANLSTDSAVAAFFTL